MTSVAPLSTAARAKATGSPRSSPTNFSLRSPVRCAVGPSAPRCIVTTTRGADRRRARDVAAHEREVAHIHRIRRREAEHHDRVARAR